MALPGAASDEFAVTLTAGPDVDAEAVIRAALESIVTRFQSQPARR